MSRLFAAVFSLSLILNISLSKAWADYDYPELSVTPRASERLAMEAKRDRNSWTAHLPVQGSALLTLAAGALQKNEPGSDRRGGAGIAVGGAWLATTLILSATYHPYESALPEINALPQKTQREQLLRERLSEEALDHAARTGRILRWTSAVTNLGASVYMLGGSTGGDTVSKASAITALAGSLLPVLFPYHWQDVANEQQNYKKKIYGPVASAMVFENQATRTYAPGVGLSLSF